MHKACVTYPDKQDKTKTIREESLNCHRCWQSVPLTADIAAIHDELTAGRKVEVLNVSKRIQGFALPDNYQASGATLFPGDLKPEPVRNSNIPDYSSNATLFA